LFNNLSPADSAYLLVAHGSRNPRPAIALAKLAYLVSQCLVDGNQPLLTKFSGEIPAQKNTLLLEKPPVLVDIATLEFAPIPLSQKIIQFADLAQSQGYKKIKIIPLFLSAGVHVTEDIPQELIKAKSSINNNISILLETFLGDYEAIGNLLSGKFQKFPQGGRILFAHGSAKTDGNLPIQNLGQKLGALNAYWAIAPSLEDQVKNLFSQGAKNITIVPYFLFVGGITDMIAQNIISLQKMYPDLNIFLDSPLGANPALAQLIANKIKQ
jgi:sirohydrochlorin cobaltochelatase